MQRDGARSPRRSAARRAVAFRERCDRRIRPAVDCRAHCAVGQCCSRDSNRPARRWPPVLAVDVGRLCPSLLLAQNPDDLLLREPARLHGPSPIRGDGLYPFLEEFAGFRSGFLSLYFHVLICAWRSEASLSR